MLDWEENVFLGLKAIHRRLFVRPEQQRRAAVAVLLKDRRGSLSLLANMIAGRSVGLFEAETPLLCGNDRIFLPPRICIASSREANVALYQIKTILGAVALRRGLAGKRRAVSPEQMALRCADELPGLIEMIRALESALPPGSDLWSWIGTWSDLPTRPLTSPLASDKGTPDPSESQPTTELEGRDQSDPVSRKAQVDLSRRTPAG